MATALLLALVGCDPGSDPVGPDGTPDDRIEVRGALIHVDGQRGNNQNPGTPAAPFATIGWALDNTEGNSPSTWPAARTRRFSRPQPHAHVQHVRDRSRRLRRSERRPGRRGRDRGRGAWDRLSQRLECGSGKVPPRTRDHGWHIVRSSICGAVVGPR
jgi:hypothetical protein